MADYQGIRLSFEGMKARPMPLLCESFFAALFALFILACLLCFLFLSICYYMVLQTKTGMDEPAQDKNGVEHLSLFAIARKVECMG